MRTSWELQLAVPLTSVYIALICLARQATEIRREFECSIKLRAHTDPGSLVLSVLKIA